MTERDHLTKLAEALRSRRARDNMTADEWHEVADIVGSDLAIDRLALAVECESLRASVVQLTSMMLEMAGRDALRTLHRLPAESCATCPRRV